MRLIYSMSTKRCPLVFRIFQHTRLRTRRLGVSDHQPRFRASFGLYGVPYSTNSFEAGSSSPTVRERLLELQLPINELYPRIKPNGKVLTCRSFLQHHRHFPSDQSNSDEEICLRGRVNSFRIAGVKLFFLDLCQEGFRVQGVCNFRKLSGNGITLESFRQYYRSLRRGDIMSMKGIPYRTNAGELSILLSELPQMLSPCLHHLPTDLNDKETRIRNRHIDLIVNPQTAHLLRLRAGIIEYLRSYLLREEHVEVQTPILADGAGGAVARPFVTSATEFPNRQISLRIAPELWLKRLVIGGFDRVFEIGPSFRNEGLDASHNPEFTTCEFYRAYTDIDELMTHTEKILSGIAIYVKQTISDSFIKWNMPTINYNSPFHRLDFIPAIEKALNRRLPDLASSNALQELSMILKENSLQLPATPSLPHILDRLSAIFLEPQCTAPTFIINHPECLSPLAKSYNHPANGQRVTARAELFVNRQEIVNTYEEENSPFEQRRKLINQVSYRTAANDKDIDESFLEALEWGLPPTGGWGCGIDRLCMAMLGVCRIGDVLSFGTLRNVVSLNQGR